MRYEKKIGLLFLSISLILFNISGLIAPIHAQGPNDVLMSPIPHSTAIQNVGILAAPCEISFFTTTITKELAMNLRFQNVTDVGNNLGKGTTYLLNSSQVDATFSIVGSTAYISDILIVYNSTDQSWYYDYAQNPISLNKVPDANNIQLQISFTLKQDATKYSNETRSIILPHQVTFTYTVVKSSVDSLTIQAQSIFSTFYSTGTSGKVNASLIKIHHYAIKNVVDNTVKKEGVLTYIESTAVWDAEADIRGLVGDFYVVITFGIDGMFNNFTAASESPNALNSFSREASITDYLMYIIIVGVVLVAFIIISFIRTAKKSKDAFERKSTTQKSKPIEIVEISKAELKRSKISSAPPPQKKVKKVDKSGLIFDVPTWEVDETETEETPEVSQGESVETTPSVTSTTKSAAAYTPIPPVAPPKKSAAPASIDYTLHCSSCNSWFEVDQFMKIDCPKCNTPLNIAMWCVTCKKWFDIPEPGDYNCPKCSNKLQYTKS